MFESDDWDDIFKRHSHGHDPWPRDSFPVMDLVVGLVVAGGVIICLALLCRCCCRKSRGRVIAPPPLPEAAAPYPQQQYTITAYPAATVVTSYPVGTTSPYPAAAPYPSGTSTSQYPAAAPYPTGAPYPNAAPYPTAGAPYPAVTPYGHNPSAPDVNAFFGIAPPGWTPQACPPSYDQVMHHSEKQPPYNPHAPL